MSPRIDPSPYPSSPIALGNYLCKLPQASAQIAASNTSYLYSTPTTYQLLENGILNSIYKLGSWVEKNFSATPAQVSQTTVGAVGQYANTQVALDQKYLDDAIKRTPVPWMDKDFLNDHFPSAYKPSPLVRIMSRLGQGLDAVSGILNVSQEFKKDIDTNNNSLSNTLNATVRSVGQISAASILGGAAAALVAGTTAPLLVGAAVGIGAGYAAGYAYDKVREWF